MKRNELSRLAGDQRGAAAVEFALWTSMFFVVVMVAIDFGAFYLDRGKVNEAISAAAVQSFASGEILEQSDMQNYVRAIGDNPAMTVTVTCNGGVTGACSNNSSRTCACLKRDGSYVASSCGSDCTGGGYTPDSVAGYYLTITASQGFEPLMIPDSVLSNATIEQQATVRLE